jgi:hypothetical protein
MEGKRPEVAAGYKLGDPLPDTFKLYHASAQEWVKSSLSAIFAVVQKIMQL